jgi:predicted DCC family thiol-disulfide oxidoreductase YuxK
MSAVGWPLRIYYDASCPLCRQEMHALVEHDAQRRIELADCSAPDFDDAPLRAQGVTSRDMLTILHAQDANGVWYRGVAVFVLAYDAVGLHSMASMWAHPWLRPIWDWIYPWFARNRMALSRFGSARLYGWLVRRAAKRAAQRAHACNENHCERR